MLNFLLLDCTYSERPSMPLRFDLLTYIFQLNETKIVVLSTMTPLPMTLESSQKISFHQHCFHLRLQGRRAGQYRKLRQKQQQKEVQAREVQTHATSSQKRRVTDMLTRSMKVRVYPNARQSQLMKQWMGCASLVYNNVRRIYLFCDLRRFKCISSPYDF